MEASDRTSGKYKEKTSRSRTPYERPKSLLGRVTDSVSGLLSGSWIPSFIRGDDASQFRLEANHLSQPGPSGLSLPCNSKTNTRNVTAIYPEEASVEESLLNSTPASSSSAQNSAAFPNNFGIAVHSTPHEYVSSATHSTLSELLPESSFREKSSKDDSFKQFSNSSRRAGEQFSCSYVQRQVFPTAQNEAPPSAANRQNELHPAVVRRQLDSTPQQSSRELRQQDDTTSAAQLSRSGATDMGFPLASARLSQSANKRPRFSLAAYSAAATSVGNKSVLSESSFRSSPFYPGRTTYGGASAYRRNPTPMTPSNSATSSLYMMGSNADAGLSRAAQRILSSLNAMSSPLADAKRVPTPTASPYVSFLESPYTAAFHKHKPQRPPTSALSTPAKSVVQHNLTQFVLPGVSSTSSSTTQEPSIFTVAAASAVRSSKPSDTPQTTATTPTSCLVVESSSSKQPVSYGTSGNSSSAGGKIRADKTRQRGTSRVNLEEVVVPPHLPNISLPKMNYVIPSFACEPPKASAEHPKTNKDASESSLVPSLSVSLKQQFTTHDQPSSSSSFKFSVPEVVVNNALISASSGLDTNQFKFSDPCSVLAVSSTNTSAADTSQAPTSKDSSSCPVAVAKPSVDINNKPELASASSSYLVSSSVSGFGGQFTPAPGSWECSMCLLRNKFEAERCVACETVKPGAKTLSNACTSNNNNNTVAKSDFGELYKKSSEEWECETCLLRNNATCKKCVACQACKPGAPSASSTDATSFGVLASSSIPTSAPASGFHFGVSCSSTSPSASSFIFGVSKDIVTDNKSQQKLEATEPVKKTSIASGFGDVFKKAPGDWTCQTCLLVNKSSARNCVSCDAAKPADKLTGSLGSSASSVPSTGFGNAFKKAAGDWECEVCLVSNKAATAKCIACETDKPGASSSTSSCYSFNPSKAASSVPMFKFSATKSPTATSCANTTSSSVAITSPTAASTTGFTLSTAVSTSSCSLSSSAAISSSSSVFNFGTAVSSSCGTIVSSSSGFSFGIPSTSSVSALTTSNASLLSYCENDCKVSAAVAKSPSFAEVNGPSALGDSNCLSVNNFTFTAPKSPTLALKMKTPAVCETKPAVPVFQSGSVIDFFKKQEAIAESKNCSSVVAREPEKPLASPVFSFGASNASNVSVFGGSIANKDSSSLSEEKVPVKSPNKRSLNLEESNPQSNVPAFSSGKNNGIAESISPMFQFGKPTANDVSSGTQSLFQFGSSGGTNKRFPSFGNSTSVFGNSATSLNNNNTLNDSSNKPMFTFGQPSEKKLHAGFDFGQATNAVPSFKFSAAPAVQFGQPSANSGVFQFGQNQSSSPALGSAASNPFSQETSTTSAGRVIKKAIRRNRK